MEAKLIDHAHLIEAFDALPDAVTIFDKQFRVLHLNSVAADLLQRAGIDAGTVIGALAFDVLPHARDVEWEHALRTAAESEAPVVFERLAPTMKRWMETRVVRHGEFIVSITRDVEKRHTAERRATESRAVLDAILNSTTDAIFVKDRDGHFLAINDAGAAALHRTPAEVIGHSLFDFAEQDVADRMRSIEEQVMRDRMPVRVEDSDLHGRYFLVARGPWFDSIGELGGIVGIATDITERRRREQETALLAEAGRVLAESLDYRATLQAVAHLVTPALADWCSVQIVKPDGEFETLGVAHANPDKIRWALEFNERYPTDPKSPTGVANVIRTGRSEMYSNITDEMLVQAALDADHLRLIRELQMHSVLIVPMSAHGRTLGAITLIGAESGRQYSERDLPLVEEIARRSAIAIENAELFRSAAAASRAKSEFLATMSHELRTPLNAIIGYAELLAEGITGPVTPAQLEQLTRVRASAGHLLGLIDEVLSFTRMEAGHDSVIPQDVQLQSVLEEAASLVRPMAQAKRLSIVIKPATPEDTCITDVLKLRQILTNLLTNAVKFTDTGEITLSARCDGDQCSFVVHDTGIGIGADYLGRVFEPFWQVEQTASRRVGGTGLGLSVTRRLARLLGGDVTVQSEAGQGSTFTVTLPRVPGLRG